MSSDTISEHFAFYKSGMAFLHIILDWDFHVIINNSENKAKLYGSRDLITELMWKNYSASVIRKKILFTSMCHTDSVQDKFS